MKTIVTLLIALFTTSVYAQNYNLSLKGDKLITIKSDSDYMIKDDFVFGIDSSEYIQLVGYGQEATVDLNKRLINIMVLDSNRDISFYLQLNTKTGVIKRSGFCEFTLKRDK